MAQESDEPYEYLGLWRKRLEKVSLQHVAMKTLQTQEKFHTFSSMPTEYIISHYGNAYLLLSVRFHLLFKLSEGFLV